MLSSKSRMSALLLLTLGPAAVLAQENPSLQSQREAEGVLARTVKAMGGRVALERIRWGRIELASQLFTEGQGARPDAGLTEQPPGRVQIELAGPRTAYENFPNENPSFRVVTGEADGSWAYIYGTNARRPLEEGAAAAFFGRVTLSPQYVLEMIDRPEALRSLGTVGSYGGEFQAVAYADRTGRQLTFYFDSESGLPVLVEGVSSHAQHGDQVISVSFDDYRDVGGLEVNHKLVLRQGHNVAAESSITSIELGAEPKLAMFEAPEGADDGPPIAVPPSGPRALEVEELAEGVYLIPNAAPNYSVMYVAYDDGVLVLESPQNPEVSRNVMRAIRERSADTEIRWVAPTHYHFDHSGGLFGYIEAGVTVVTTEGNADFVRRIAEAPRSVGELGARAEYEAKVETFESRRVFGSDARRVELIDVGPNPHVDEILVAHFPALRLLFVADLFSFNGNVNPANQNLLAFAARLEELDLEFESVIPVHGQRATAEQFWESVRLGRAQQTSD